MAVEVACAYSCQARSAEARGLTRRGAGCVHAEHRGVPLAFVPFVATRQGALEALDDGPLFGEVLSHVGRAFKALKDAERHNPQ